MKRHLAVEEAVAIAVVGPCVVTPPVQTTRVALEQLFADHARRLVGALSVYTGDRSEAEDLAQEAFARLYANWSRSAIRTAGGELSLLGRLQPRPVSWTAHGDAGPSPGEIRARDPDRDPEDEALRGFANETTTSAVAQPLPAKQRACVILHYYADLRVADTAAALGISTNSAKTHLRRALATLRVAARGGHRIMTGIDADLRTSFARHEGHVVLDRDFLDGAIQRGERRIRVRRCRRAVAGVAVVALLVGAGVAFLDRSPTE